MTNRLKFIWGHPGPSLAPTRYLRPASRPAPAITAFVYGSAPEGDAGPAPRPLVLARSKARSRRGPLAWLRRLGAAFLAAFVMTACGTADATPAADKGEASPAPAGPPAVAIEVAVARRASIARQVAVAGRIEALQSIDVRPEVDGRIVSIVAKEGQAVAAGAPLFRIDDAELKAQVARATAERDLARQALTRTRELLAENASSRADLERAEALSLSAQAQLDLLSVRLARTTVRAPFGGVVGRRLVSIGDVVSPQVPLTTLQTTNPQRIVLDVPERFAAALRRGQPVEFAVAAFPERRFTATVDFVDPVVALPARTITVKGLASNTDGVLQAGMFSEARLATTTRDDAVLIPEQALMPAPGGRNAVWVVSDGVATRRDVTIGVRRAGDVEITAGVAAGEQVVVGGVLQLTDGIPVHATIVDEATPNDGRAAARGK